MDNLLENYIKELQQITTIKQYNDCLNNLNQALTSECYGAAIIQTVRAKGKYMVNKFSDESTMESMLKAKENLITYLKSIVQEEIKDTTMAIQECLKEYLHNFFFLEAFVMKKKILCGSYLELIQHRRKLLITGVNRKLFLML